MTCCIRQPTTRKGGNRIVPPVILRVFEFRSRDLTIPGHLQRALTDGNLWYGRARDGETWNKWEPDVRLNKWHPAIDVMERRMAYAPWCELNLEEVT